MISVWSFLFLFLNLGLLGMDPGEGQRHCSPSKLKKSRFWFLFNCIFEGLVFRVLY